MAIVANIREMAALSVKKKQSAYHVGRGNKKGPTVDEAKYLRATPTKKKEKTRSF